MSLVLGTTILDLKNMDFKSATLFVYKFNISSSNCKNSIFDKCMYTKNWFKNIVQLHHTKAELL